jgi:hypothetical protein
MTRGVKNLPGPLNPAKDEPIYSTDLRRIFHELVGQSKCGTGGVLDLPRALPGALRERAFFERRSPDLSSSA